MATVTDQSQLLEDCARLSGDDDLIGPGVRIFAFYLQVALNIVVALLPGSDFSGPAWSMLFTYWALLATAAIQLDNGKLTLLQSIIICRLLLLHSFGSSVSLIARYCTNVTAGNGHNSVYAIAAPGTPPAAAPSVSGLSLPNVPHNYPAQAGANGQACAPYALIPAPPAPCQRTASIPLKVVVFASHIATLAFSLRVYNQSSSIGDNEICNNLAKDVVLGLKPIPAINEGTKAGLGIHITLASIYLLIRVLRLITWLSRKLKRWLPHHNFHLWEFDSLIRDDESTIINLEARDRRIAFSWRRTLVLGISAYFWGLLIAEVERTLIENRISDTWTSFGQILAIATPLVPAKAILEWSFNWWRRQNKTLPLGTPPVSRSRKIWLATWEIGKWFWEIACWPVVLILHMVGLYNSGSH